MDFTVDIAVHFFRGREPEIFYGTDAKGDDDILFADVMALAYFSIRTLTHLASDYRDWASKATQEWISIGNHSQTVSELAEDQIVRLFSPWKTPDYSGREGSKRFQARLRCIDDRPEFVLEPRGFGLLKMEFGKLSHASTFILLSHLVLQSVHNKYKVECLCRTIGACGSLYETGEIFKISEGLAAFNALGLGLGRPISNRPGRTIEDEVEEVRLGQKAHEGHIESQVKYGLLYEQRGEHAQAAQWFEKAAERGDPDGLRLLGDMYRDGKGVPQDSSRSAELYRRGSESGDSWCQINLAVSYMRGDGVPRDVTRAIRLLEVAADNSAVEAMTMLGHIFSKGDGVPVGMLTAADWYGKASREGDPVAENCLGTMYSKGEGVKQDHAEAVRWFHEAALKGYAHAQYNLAQSYCNGKGVQENWSEAKRWFYESAKNGLVDGQIQLAIMLESEGQIDDAKKWYFLAAQQGHEIAKKRLKEIL